MGQRLEEMRVRQGAGTASQLPLPIGRPRPSEPPQHTCWQDGLPRGVSEDGAGTYRPALWGQGSARGTAAATVGPSHQPVPQERGNTVHADLHTTGHSPNWAQYGPHQPARGETAVVLNKWYQIRGTWKEHGLAPFI